MKKIFSAFFTLVGLLLVSHYINAATLGLYIIGDGSGGGGGAGGDALIIAAGGTGGAGGGGADTINGSAGNDVIFGDGSGGGSAYGGGSGGAGGGGADIINGGAGNDVIFGDGFNGNGDSVWSNNYGGLGGGGGAGGHGVWAGGPGGGSGGIAAGGGGGAANNGGGGSTIISGIGSVGGSAGTTGGSGGASAMDTDSNTGTGGTFGGYGGGGGGGFGGASGGAGGDLDVRGVSGANGDTNQHSYNDSTGAIKSYFTLTVLRNLLTNYPGYGAGNDTINGGAGTNDLFGLGGNNTFIIDSVNSSTLDRIWDFKVGDKIKLETSGEVISQASANAVLAGETFADYDGDGTADDVGFTFGGVPIQIMNNISMVFSADSNGDITVASGTPQTLTYVAGTGGSLTGSSTQTVNYHANGTSVTAVANTGYYFVNWSDASVTNPRIDYNVSTSSTYTANFAATTYALTYTAGTGGSVSGSLSQIINYGSNGTAVTAVPNTGYSFVNWSDASTTNPRTDYNITATTTLTANFSINTFTLAYSAGTGGTISGSGSQTVDYNSNGTAVTAVPGSGYTFSHWSDGSTANPRTDTGVTANVSVTASFSNISSSPIVSVPSVGTGVIDVAIPMYELKAISEVKPDGTNVLAYIGSTGDFNITVSQTHTVVEHHFKIINVDMLNKIITVEIMSEPKTVKLGMGEIKNIDLDGDNVSDMSLSFNELLNNRIDLTIKQLAFAEIKKAEVKPEVKSEIKPEIKLTAPVKQSTAYTFKRDLKYGMSGTDVKELQKYLNLNGFAVAKSGTGSLGKETNQFGPATRNALIKFQKAKGITPAAGYFGLVTKKVVNK